MAICFKFRDNKYLDSTGIVHNKELLSTKIIHSTGSNENGDYIKFEDGTMICYGEKTISNITIGTAWGSMYESSGKYDFGLFPLEFKNIPRLIIQQKEGPSVMLQTLGNTTTETELGRTWLFSPVTRNDVECIFFYIAIGKWK